MSILSYFLFFPENEIVFAMLENNVQVEAGSSANLKCKAYGTGPLQAAWKKGSVPVLPFDRLVTEMIYQDSLCS